MADPISSDNKRYEQARIQQERANDRQLKVLKYKNKMEVDRSVAFSSDQKDKLDKDYDVALTTQQAQHEAKLNEVREQNMQALEAARSDGEEELSKVKARYAEQISRYKDQNEKHLEAMRRDYQKQEVNITSRAEKKGIT